MKTRAIAGTFLAVALAAGFVCVWKLQERLDTERSKVESERDELALRSPGVMKKLSLEYAPLMGAIYWTRAVQYYGQKHHLGDQNLELLWPLLDISSTLDPNLIVVYRFGAIFLSDALPRGAGEPEKAVELLERGIKANPDDWRLYQDLGNVYYFDEKNYLKASKAFEEGSRNPAAMSWMKIMAAKIAAEGESLETSYALWLDIYQTTTDKEIRKNAEVHLRLVKAQMDLRNLDLAADEFAKKTRKPARSISDLVQAGLLPGQLLDPDGFPYVMGEDGKAELNPKSPLREDWLREKKWRSNAAIN
jgi:tetratricopeptide (TPR) repeat protein